MKADRQTLSMVETCLNDLDQEDSATFDGSLQCPLEIEEAAIANEMPLLMPVLSQDQGLMERMISTDRSETQKSTNENTSG